MDVHVDQPTSRGGFAQIVVEPPPEALCRGCRYPLRGLASHRCPECGRPFDPCDIETMHLPTWHGWLARRFLPRAGIILYAWPAVGALLIYWAGQWRTRISIGTEPYAQVVLPAWVPLLRIWWADVWHAAAWCWAGLLAYWLIRAAGRRLVVEMYRLPIDRLHVDRPARRFACACFVLGILIGGPHTDRCTHGEYWEFWRTLGVVRESPTGDFPAEHAKRSFPLGRGWHVYWRR